MEKAAPSTARQAGLGVAWLTAAKLYFMGTGLLLLLVLPSLFKRFAGEDHVALWGDYRTVSGLVNWFNMVLIGGTLQAVSKFISEKEDRAWSVKWQTLKLQVVIGGAAFLALLLPADFVATRFYKDAALAPYLRLAAPIVLLYALYAVIIGSMNGLKRFRHQATMDMLFATLKVALTIGLVAAGFAIAGAILGFVLTAAVMLGVSAVALGRQPRGETVSWKAILAFEWQTLLFAFFLNGLLQVDVQLLKSLAPPSLGPGSDQVGIYAAAQQISQIPYVATISVAFVVFPLISRAVFDQDMHKAAQYVSTTNRWVWVALVGIVAPLTFNAAGVLDAIYPEEYVKGAATFSALCGSYLFFAGMVVNANILTGSGAPALSAGIFGASLALAAGLCVLLIPSHGGQGAALAMGFAMVAGFAASGFAVRRRFGTFLPSLTLLRTAAACAVLFALDRYALPPAASAVMVVVRLAGFFAVYVLCLAVLGELPLARLRDRIRSRTR